MHHLKQSIRSDLLQKLPLIHSKRKEEASQAAYKFLIDHFKTSNTKVLSFASKPFELNLWPLNKWLAEKNRLLLPKIENGCLEIYEVNDWSGLKLSSLGIQEPSPLLCKKINPEELDLIVLVPALCFDENLHRVGYGKGHYDKFLPTALKAQKWGIGFKEQQFSCLPVEPHDLAMDEVFLF